MKQQLYCMIARFQSERTDTYISGKITNTKTGSHLTSQLIIANCPKAIS